MRGISELVSVVSRPLWDIEWSSGRSQWPVCDGIMCAENTQGELLISLKILSELWYNDSSANIMVVYTYLN